MKGTSSALLVILLFKICVTTARSCEGCLLLSPYIAQSAQLARNLSKVDPQPFQGLRSYSGFVNVNERHGSNMFFWFFPAEDMENTPWLIWLGGGPGVSALKGLFEDVGPLRVVDEQVLYRNTSWASDYSVLFLDSPVGAGFSFTDCDEGVPNNEEDVGAEILVFLEQFLQMFPELRTAPLFVTGISYAGKFAPALAIQIHRNKRKIPTNLRGIAVGNGLVEPRNMMNYSRLCSVLGLLDDAKVEELRGIEQEAVRLTDEGKMAEAAQKFNETIEFIKKTTGVSVYDFTKDNAARAPTFEAFVNSPEVRQHLHVGNATFDYNSQKVYEIMLADIANSTKPLIEELLESYGVLSFSGQKDIIVAYSLTENVFKTMNWSHKADYTKATRRRVFDRNHNVVAYKKMGGNFVNVLIRNAGHSAPADQPEVTKFIIDDFIQTFQ